MFDESITEKSLSEFADINYLNLLKQKNAWSLIKALAFMRHLKISEP